MDFHLSPAQQDLQERAQRLLTDGFSSAQVREAEASAERYPRAVWEAATAQGWPGLAVDAVSGHGEHGLLDLCVLLEEVGRAAATLPLVVSSGVAATMLHDSPHGDERDRLLGDIASGAIVTPVLIDEQGRNEWDSVRLPLVPHDDGYRVTGTKVLAPFAAVARELLVTAATSDGAVAIVAIDASDRGVMITTHHTKVGVPLASVHFDDVHVSAEHVVHQGPGAQRALDAGLQIGTLLSTAEAVGMCEALIAMTAAYVTERQAFGRSIGTFQAVAHPCADMRVSADAVRILVHQAAWLLDNGRSADEEVPATKGLANEHFQRVANDAYRLHGALGFSVECDVQLYMRRLQGFFGSFGETQESYERAAAAVGM